VFEGAAAVAVDDAEEAVEVEVKSGNNDEVEGSGTPTQRRLTSDPAQQESVAFGELAAQYRQRPWRLVEKPQLSGSLCSAGMHAPLRESAGNAQLVKSALIWLM
jgi:hypothetical protein